MDDKKIKGTNIDVWYNVYDQMIYICKFFGYIDGNIVYFDLQSDEILDLYSFDIHGYKKIKNNGGFVNANLEYDISQLVKLEETYNSRDIRPKLPEEQLMSLAMVQDRIKEQAFDYDKRYPVEYLEIRHSEELGDFLILLAKFDHSRKTFAYFDMCNGVEVTGELLI